MRIRRQAHGTRLMDLSANSCTNCRFFCFECRKGLKPRHFVVAAGVVATGRGVEERSIIKDLKRRSAARRRPNRPPPGRRRRLTRPTRYRVGPARVSRPQVDLPRCGLDKTPTLLTLWSVTGRVRERRRRRGFRGNARYASSSTGMTANMAHSTSHSWLLQLLILCPSVHALGRWSRQIT
jgi:hypothetical protein